MLKIFSIFSLALLYIAVAYGQATIDFPITVSNDAGQTSDIYFGLDLTATDGVDTHLGEAALPGFPPGGYAAAWLYPDFTTLSYNDYRAPGDPPAFPYTGHKSFTIKLQNDLTANPMTVSWNLPGTIAATSTITAGTNVESFSGIGSISFDYNPVSLQYILVEVDFIDIVPVELTSFTASVSEGSVILNWTTATEINNQGFEIERTTPGQSWTQIGYVPGFGTTTEPKTYSLIDANVVTGSYSYRLKQIDYDGTFSYSDEIEVEVDFAPNNYALFQNYPNPFNPSTSVRFQVPQTSSVTVKIYDMLGQEVRTLFAGEVVRGIYKANWNGLNDAGVQMSSGSYIYKMVAGDFVQSMKMVLLK